MIIRRSHERGHANHGWLDSHHTFSFANYFDPRHMGFSHLRVINEDRVAPGRGFGAHPHRDMEIISYVLDGGLEHRDSMGTGSVIRPGDVQLMSAGTGVTHSEFNASHKEPVHFLQIWIEPAQRFTEPRYEQRAFDPADSRNRFRVIVSPDGDGDALTINQDAALMNAHLDPDATAAWTLPEGRKAWLHIVRGTVQLDDTVLQHGDAAAFTEPREIRVRGVESAELLLFNLAG